MRMLTGDSQRAMTSQQAAESDSDECHSVAELEDNDILD